MIGIQHQLYPEAELLLKLEAAAGTLTCQSIIMSIHIIPATGKFIYIDLAKHCKPLWASDEAYEDPDDDTEPTSTLEAVDQLLERAFTLIS
jgi:hypothetical protein